MTAKQLVVEWSCEMQIKIEYYDEAMNPVVLETHPEFEDLLQIKFGNRKPVSFTVDEVKWLREALDAYERALAR